MHIRTPTRPTLTRINTSQLTWTCPQHVYRPHNSAVFTGTAGPQGRQASRLCLYTHTCPVCQEKWPPLSPGGTQCGTPAWPRTRCKYHLAWPDCLQHAANRQCGGGQCFKLCSGITRTAWHAPHCELYIQFWGLLAQGVVASLIFLQGQVTIFWKDLCKTL